MSERERVREGGTGRVYEREVFEHLCFENGDFFSFVIDDEKKISELRAKIKRHFQMEMKY